MKMRFILSITVISFCMINMLQSQITYNREKPFSYNKQELSPINKLPVINFSVDADGNLFEKDVKVNFKKSCLIEKKNDRFVARLIIKVHAEKLGMITIICKDVKLNNDARCYVYTKDMQIVAGPIYQKSIIDDIVISNLPADELIIEIVANNQDDFEMKLDEVDYVENKVKNKKYSEKLQEGYKLKYEPWSNWNWGNKLDFCGQNQVAYYDNYSDSNLAGRENSCGNLGGGDPFIFNNSNFKSINDYQYDASRASCIIMTPPNEMDRDSYRYQGTNGTLINFPYNDCENPDDCGTGFVVGVYHTGPAEFIKDYEFGVYNSSTFKNQSPDSTDLSSRLAHTIIRFNSHYKYGTPWNLRYVNCMSTDANFQKWRSTIDFSEVVDYCGVKIFAYGINTPEPGDGFAGPDILILKMNQRPFYKELHLGWTTQAQFAGVTHDKFKVIGRKASNTTHLIENTNVGYSYDQSRPKYDKINLTVNQNGNFDMNGYSGSQLTYTDYIDTNQRIGLGLLTNGTGGTTFYAVRFKSYNCLFNAFDSIHFILPDCYLSPNHDYQTDSTSTIMTYLLPKYNLKIHSETNSAETYKWMPSVENKDLCPSSQGVGSPYDNCTFDLNNYVIYAMFTDPDYCLTINPIDQNEFPGHIMPSGYRIYYKYGDQKTIKYKSFTDPEDIFAPNIVFCISKCELMYLMAIGKDHFEIGIDFYDADGKILYNPGCRDIKININNPLDICDLLGTAQIELVPWAGHPSHLEPCCKYRITLNTNIECSDENNPASRMIFDNIYFEYENNPPIKIKEISGVNINYTTGAISFEQVVCHVNNGFKFKYKKNNRECETVAFHDFPFCICECNVNKQDWFELTVMPGSQITSCGPDQCSVSGKITIPEFFNCPNQSYTYYSISPYSYKFAIQQNGTIPQYNTGPLACLQKGEYRLDTLRLFKTLDTNEIPCIIIKPAFCPDEMAVKPCTPDCDSVKWNEDSLDVPLPGCSTCSVKAKYNWRRNNCYNPRKQDIQITYFATYNNSVDTTACANCILTDDEIHKFVLLKAIYDNAMGFDPQPPNYGCDETWRVIQSSCWAKYYDNVFNPGGAMIYRPCDSTECCSVGLKVCRFEGPPQYITIDTLGGINGGNLCTSSTLRIVDPVGFGTPVYHTNNPNDTTNYTITYYNIDTLQCQDRCNWLYGLKDDGFYGKKAIQYDIESKEHHGFDAINIKIKFYDDYLYFNIKSDIASEDLNIYVSSLQGFNLLSNKLRLKKGENQYQIQTQNLITGIYFISIQVNSLLFKTEKIIIIR